MKTKSKSIASLKQVKANAQIRLINKRIQQIEKPQSWFKKNVVAIAAVGVSLISVLAPKASSVTNIYIEPPKAERVVDEYRKREIKPLPTEPFEPPRHPGLPTNPLMPIITIPTQQDIDPETLAVLRNVMEVLERSDDPIATKAKIVEGLRDQPRLHKRLVDDAFIKKLLDQIEKVEVLQADEVWRDEHKAESPTSDTGIPR
jgi:hypothetical protein